jgi:large subunit ribosomal protein L6
MSAARSWHTFGKEDKIMSRIGKMPITVPAGVEVKVADNLVTVKGPKGTLSQQFSKELEIKLEDGTLTVARPSDDKKHRSLHGLTRTLIHNMVEGVVNGYSKTLEIDGVGYRAQKQGKNVELNLGFSHKVIIPETEDIQLEVPQPNIVVVKGIDKQKVGQYAAEIREKRPPEPYKGKGIHYQGEHIIRKEGKAGKGKK